jgi:hypothetical protein
MKTIETKVYLYSELTDERAKSAARDWYLSGAFDYEWWDSTFEDAKNIGLEITSFDIERNRHAKGKFTDSATSCADKIIAEHGDTCETYKDAEKFLSERDSIVESAERDEDGEFVNEYELDEKLDACESDFLKTILEDYAILLQKEYEYMCSEDSIKEAMDCNEYTFTADGKRMG